MGNNDDIQKFITAHKDASELKSQAYEIKQSVDNIEESVVSRVIKIRDIRATAFKTKARGRVDDIVYINNSEVCFSVSYCGCCENDEEELEVELLLMDDEKVLEIFSKRKAELDREKLEKERKEKAIQKAELKAHDKAEYERLKGKFEGKQDG